MTRVVFSLLAPLDNRRWFWNADTLGDGSRLVWAM